MNILDEFRWQARTAFDWLESIVRDVTPAQAAWQPPGRANTIAATYAHIVRNVDEDINQWLFRRPRLNEGAWRGRTGIPNDTGELEFGVVFDWPALRDYGRAITEFVTATFEQLSEEDLEIVTDLSTPGISRWRGIDIIRLTGGDHVRMHGGEIACLKGLQGLKGYMGGLDSDSP
jgi:hypothetical protein